MHVWTDIVKLLQSDAGVTPLASAQAGAFIAATWIAAAMSLRGPAGNLHRRIAARVAATLS